MPAIHEKRSPQVRDILSVLERHEVQYVIAGSVAAMAYGVDLVAGDLDVVPSTDLENLTRLVAVLVELEARPLGPFGSWTTQGDGEQKWIARPTTPEEVASWRPRADDISTLDNLYVSRLGNFDVVPVIMGTYEFLMKRARRVPAFGLEPFVAHIDEVLAKMTVARREKDFPRVAALREIQRGLGAAGR
jgi:hypothetical protein